MSACLFTVSNQYFQQVSIEQIRKDMIYWEDVINDFKNRPEKQDNRYEQDRFHGTRDNLEHASYFLMGYNRAILNPSQGNTDPMT